MLVGGGNWNGDLQSNTHAQGQTTVVKTDYSQSPNSFWENRRVSSSQPNQGMYAQCSGGSWNEDLQRKTRAKGQTNSPLLNWLAVNHRTHCLCLDSMDLKQEPEPDSIAISTFVPILVEFDKYRESETSRLV